MTDVSVHDADPRRPYWLIGFTAPMLAPLLFGIAPIIDHLFGRDYRNVSPEVALALESDPYYHRLMYGIVPGYAVGILAAAAMTTVLELSLFQWIIFTVGIASVHSLLVLVAHELGHAHSKIDKRMADFALSLIAYGHFGVEHNVGHHKKVAKPEDPASARFNESIYRFALREIPGVFFGALEKEGDRLKRRGLPWWSIQNRLLGSCGVSCIILLALVALLGTEVIPFLVLHSAVAWFSITMANYTAHRGLMREMIYRKREPCQRWHSWSSSFLFSNLLFFNLQRHADHHSNAQRQFQSLSFLEDTPQLPAGIPGLFCMMLLPPVWFRVMNARLLEAVEYKASRINFHRPSDVERLASHH